MKAAIKPFRKALRGDKKSGRAGWDLLMHYDTLSTRQFLGMYVQPHLPLSYHYQEYTTNTSPS